MLAARIAAGGYCSAHFFENIGGLLDALPGNMRIGIAGSKERRGACQVAWVVEVSVRRADQATRKCNHCRVSPRVGRDELACQTSSLGKTAYDNALGRNT